MMMKGRGRNEDVSMKTNKQLLRIWKNKEKNTRDFYKYHSLSPEEKSRLFDILAMKQGVRG